jgi:hypothetical protein
MTGNDPIDSGRGYTVTHIDGQPPGSLEDFTGEVWLTVNKDGAPTLLVGVGGETANGVRFYQKDPALSDRDIRVWMITKSANGFRAEPLSVF